MISSHIYKKLLHFSIILFLIATIIPQISTVENAQSTELGIFNTDGFFQGNVELSYDSNDIPDTILPEVDTAKVKLYINYYVSGRFAEYLIPLLGDITVPIQLSIGDHPDYVDIKLSPEIVYLKVSTTRSSSPEISEISISLHPMALGFQLQSFNVSAISSQMQGRFGFINWIRSSTNKIEISYVPGYYSNFNYQIEPYREIGAGETVEFPIEVTGFANTLAKLTFEVLDPPEGWSTGIDPELTLGTSALGQDSTATQIFTIQSPLTSGYYNEVEQFQIRVTTMAAGHPEAGIDNKTILQFTVRAKGHFDDENSFDLISSYLMAIVLTAISAVILLILIIILKKKYRIQK